MASYPKWINQWQPIWRMKCLRMNVTTQRINMTSGVTVVGELTAKQILAGVIQEVVTRSLKFAISTGPRTDIRAFLSSSGSGY